MTKSNEKKVIVVKKKKVNVKDQAKQEVMQIIQDALEKEGIVFKDGVDYAMTNGTIIAEHKLADVQIKPISPRAGLDRYQEIKVVYE